MKTLEEIKKEFDEEFRGRVCDGVGEDNGDTREEIWQFIESAISQTKQELIEEAKQKILKIPDETICPDKYYKKYTNNWKSQHTRNPSGRAWIMWFLENYLTNE